MIQKHRDDDINPTTTVFLRDVALDSPTLRAVIGMAAGLPANHAEGDAQRTTTRRGGAAQNSVQLAIGHVMERAADAGAPDGPDERPDPPWWVSYRFSVELPCVLPFGHPFSDLLPRMPEACLDTGATSDTFEDTVRALTLLYYDARLVTRLC